MVMNDRSNGLAAFLKTPSHQAAATGWHDKDKPREEEAIKPDEEEDSCLAFGYLRGIRDRALAVEFRYRDGNREWFPYSCLGPWRFDPSVGLLLKFTGDVVTLVLIRGSNLDALVGQGTVNLTDRGLQRHRVLWVREMDEEELRRVGEGGPTIDRIEVAEFESQEELREWLKKVAPSFVRK
jgi:hypothetical protein